MAKETYYYVLVFTQSGPIYVTSQDYATKTAFWEKDKEPKLFTMHTAEDLTFGLRCNGHQAVTVKSPAVIDYQPYRYSAYKIVWEEIKGEDK